MNNFNTLVRSRYSNYLKHLRNGGKRVQLPKRPEHDPELSDGRFHPSAAGDCPLKIARNRNNVPLVLPPTEEQELNSWHTMEQSTRDGELFQEAMMYRHFADTWIEVSVSTSTLRGRIDVMMEQPEGFHILELKRRDGYTTQSAPNPKLDDLWQLMCYGMVFPQATMHLVLMNRYSGNLDKNPPGFQIWTLVREDNGFVLLDEGGSLWESEDNNPKTLSYMALNEEINTHLRFLEGIDKHMEVDPLNGPYWCCTWVGQKPYAYKKDKAGKTERNEYAVPSCKHFCHWNIEDGIAEPFLVREVAYGAGVFAPVDAIPTKF